MRTLLPLAIAAVLPLIILQCGNDPLASSGSQTTNSNCIGKIFNADGSAAVGATVRLLPGAYDPTTPAFETIDSTITMSNGSYAFTVKRSDYYNIIAQKEDALCMQDLIPILASEKTIVNNDTLRESGTLVGRVTLKNGDDPRSVVILIRGTNIYTLPNDSTGNFTSPPLPAGNFPVQILFTGGSGYAVIDTPITIFNGKTTELIVTMPSINAPSVTDFAADYDSMTMYATLRWASVDTSKIVSYSLYRKCTQGHDTMMLIDKSATTYIDDLVLIEDDTITYHITAVGKNYKEGYESGARTIVPWSTLHETKTTLLQFDTEIFRNIPGGPISIDGQGNVFIACQSSIVKFDTNGVPIRTYALAKDFRCEENLYNDDEDNIYFLKTSTQGNAADHFLVKLDNELNVVGELPVVDTLRANKSLSFTVSGSGTIVVVVDSLWPAEYDPNCSRHVRNYDAQFNKNNDYYSESTSKIYHIHRFGDTIVTIVNALDYGTRETEHRPYYWLNYYDMSFKYLGSFETMDFLNKYLPSYGGNFGQLFLDAGPGGLIFARTYLKEKTLLLITDQGQQLLARKISQGSIYFDKAGNSYGLSVSLNDRTATLYKYPTERLFTRTVP